MNPCSLVAATTRLAGQAILFAGFAVAAVETSAVDGTFAIRDVRIFDGRNVIERGTVVVVGSKIYAMAADASIIPAGAQVIDGAGKTLLPGLIDAHVHFTESYNKNGADALEHAAVYGITTVLDMGTRPGSNWQDFKRRVKAGEFPNGADLFAAGYGAAARGGFSGAPGVPTIDGPAEAQAWVDARIAEGSDYIKIFSQDGTEHFRPVPALSQETIGAIIDAAHKRGVKTIAHIFRNYRIQSAIEQGIDGLVHITPYDYPLPDFGHLMARHDTFHSTNMISYASPLFKGRLAQDPDLGPFMPEWMKEELKTAKVFSVDSNHEFVIAAVNQMIQAHVPILAGSDIGYPYAPLLHAEIEILTKDCGMVPVEALRAATSNTATAYNLADRGAIRPGLNADLLLVNGDPTKDITHTRRIEAVWRLGHRIDREAFKAKVAVMVQPPRLGPPPGTAPVGAPPAPTPSSK